MWQNLGMYKKGTHCKGARERQALGLRTTEGKDPIPLVAYIHLASILNRSNDPEHVAAHLFLLLDWNLMSRADFVVTSNIELVGVWNDALCFQVGVTKTDQEGSKHVDHPFHVYSCPENPVICPVLALSKHLLCNPRILRGKCKLFEGSNQYERFNSILRSIVQSDEYRNEFIDFGVHPKYFGTHSMRKGTASHHYDR